MDCHAYGISLLSTTQLDVFYESSVRRKLHWNKYCHFEKMIHHWLHQKLSKWQFPVQPVMNFFYQIDDISISLYHLPAHITVLYWVMMY